MASHNFMSRNGSGKDGGLCNDCHKLGLSREKFLIGSSELARSIGLMPTSSRTRMAHMTPPSRSSLNSGFGSRSLGKVSKIKTNAEEKGCSFCTLVWKAVKRYSRELAENLEVNGVSSAASSTAYESEADVGHLVNNQSKLEHFAHKVQKPDADPDPACFMVWEIDGRQAKGRRTGATTREEDDTQYSNVSRRIRFWWKQPGGQDHVGTQDQEQECYILFVPPHNPHRPNADGSGYERGMWAKSEFLARDFDTEKTQYTLIRSWLELCDKHDPSCTSVYEPGRFEWLRQQNWFGVIDVVHMKLCRLPAYPGAGWDRYVALSYVWGPPPAPGGPEHRTLRKNVIHRTYPGSIEERSLPKTICEAIQLTRDLGLRYIWIDSLCIVQDSYASFKLNADQMDLIYGNAYLTICAADGDNSKEGLTALDPRDADKPIANDVEGMRLQVSRPSESIIRGSVWDQRGWTFQERILSPRCLVFAGGRFYFQCRKSNMSQDIHPDTTGNGLSMDWVNSPLRTLRGLETRPMSLYMTFVSLYTGRHLTQAEDILSAFEGVAGLMKTHMHGDRARFIYGLPPSHFDLALLWEPLSAQKRRVPSDAHRYGQVKMELPSWSWAGWTDASVGEKGSSVKEHGQGANSNKGSRVRYNGHTLDGCLADLHEWLLRHTWIQWFIRNSSGDLRPIWDKRLMSGAQNVLPRWRGYAVDEDVRAVQIPQPPFPGHAYAGHPTDANDGPPPNMPDGYYWNEGNRHVTNVNVTNVIHRHGSRSVYHSQSVDGDSAQNSDSSQRYSESESNYNASRDSRNHVRPEGARPADEDVRQRHGSLSPRKEVAPPPPIIAPAEEPAQVTDDYGREVQGMVTRGWPEFRYTICDTPFGVNVVGLDDERSCLPDQAILQFFTLAAQFSILVNDEATDAARPGNGLVRCDVVDDNNDWCGHIVLSEDWAREHDGAKLQFIALSDAKSFTREECRHWAHYIPREQEDVDWDLYYVLLIERNQERVLWERVGLGKVIKAAFEVSGATRQEILLG